MKFLAPLLAILMVLLGLTTTMAAGPHSHFNSATSSHHETHDNGDEQSRADHSSHAQQGDCHCPTHRTTCCGSMLLFAKVNSPQLPFIELVVKFAESRYAAFPAPSLEGPFQPPRA